MLWISTKKPQETSPADGDRDNKPSATTASVVEVSSEGRSIAQIERQVTAWSWDDAIWRAALNRNRMLFRFSVPLNEAEVRGLSSALGLPVQVVSPQTGKNGRSFRTPPNNDRRMGVPVWFLVSCSGALSLAKQSPAARRAPIARPIRSARMKNLEGLHAAGIELYPYRFDKTHTVEQLHAAGFPGLAAQVRWFVYPGVLSPAAATGVRFFGIWHLRPMGAHSAFDCSDQAESRRRRGSELSDLGDWIGAVGTCMHTRTGEPTILVQESMMLTKTTRPLPNFKGERADRHRDGGSDALTRDDP